MDGLYDTVFWGLWIGYELFGYVLTLPNKLRDEINISFDSWWGSDGGER